MGILRQVTLNKVGKNVEITAGWNGIKYWKRMTQIGSRICSKMNVYPNVMHVA